MKEFRLDVMLAQVLRALDLGGGQAIENARISSNCSLRHPAVAVLHPSH